MAEPKTAATETEISRERLAELLNEDLSREYQAIISYVVYSQVLKGAEYMDIANQLEIHAKQELDHALTISRQIDYLGRCLLSRQSLFGHRKKRRTCCVLISRMKTRRSEIIVTVSASAKRLANLLWPSRFVRF
jgi:rubrerythrin